MCILYVIIWIDIFSKEMQKIALSDKTIIWGERRLYFFFFFFLKIIWTVFLPYAYIAFT